MTNLGTPTPTGGPTSATSSSGGVEAAKERAQETKETAKQATSEVAQTATEKAKEVADETKRQARNLVGETREHLTGQVQQQHQNLVDQLRSLAGEFSSMANGTSTGQGGVANELVTQAGDRAQQVVSWLENREPADLINEVRRFARQRPGAFLAGAAIAGIVAGRLTRGAVAAHQEDARNSSIDYTKSSANYQSYTGVRHPSPTPTTEWAAGYQPTQTTGAAYGTGTGTGFDTGTAYDPGYAAPATTGYSTPPAGHGVEQYPGGAGYMPGDGR